MMRDQNATIVRLNAIIDNLREENRRLQWALHRERNPIAQAIEAQRAETAKTGSVADESAVGTADVPKGSPVGSQIG